MVKNLPNSVGDVYGSGYGDGYGYGDGSGYGSGSGDGYGDGYGLKSFVGSPVHYVDGVPTVITKVHGNLAKGFIVNNDLTTQPCFIAKGKYKFAHGSTFVEAQKALQDKLFDDMDPEEKIELFLNEFNPGIKYPAKSFYEWHHKLTGSCEFGRNAFVKDHGIDLDNGTYTVEEFIDITKHDYGGDIIQQLEERIREI